MDPAEVFASQSAHRRTWPAPWVEGRNRQLDDRRFFRVGPIRWRCGDRIHSVRGVKVASMEAHESSAREYVLGNRAPELARLDAQAKTIEPATRLLLRASGIGAGMRALDLGTGLGHVAQLVAELVGPNGSVVGLDQSADALDEARRRAGDR